MQTPITARPTSTPLWTFAISLAVGSAYVATVASKRLDTPNTYRLIRENNLDMYTLGTLWGLEPCLYIQTACWSGLRFVRYINEISNEGPDTRWYQPSSLLKLSSAFLPAFVHNVVRSLYTPRVMRFTTNQLHSTLIENAYFTVRKEMKSERISLVRVLNDIDDMPFPREIAQIICEFASPNFLHENENKYWTQRYKSPTQNTLDCWAEFVDSKYFQKYLPKIVMGVMCGQFVYSMFASAAVGNGMGEDDEILFLSQLPDGYVSNVGRGEDGSMSVSSSSSSSSHYDMLLGRDLSTVEQVGVRALLLADVSGFVVCSYFLVKYHWDDLVRLVE